MSRTTVINPAQKFTISVRVEPVETRPSTSSGRTVFKGRINNSANYRNTWKTWAALAAPGILLIAIFHEIMGVLADIWWGSEEYSHGLMIPFIAGFLIWQMHKELAAFDYRGSWRGMALLATGIGVYVVGELASLQVFLEYAVLVMLMGGLWAIVGDTLFRRIWIPVFFMFFAIPLPEFLYQGLSGKLQLLSSWLGVSFIRACDISVFLEGNVIDLGAMKLQVAEACNGLRYLFPLTSVAFICAYFYQAPLWKRAIVFLSSIPLTILMNSFRIGAIGVMVEYWGKSMAEGFLHDFEGWIVFMGCTAILLGIMWLLARIGNDPRPLREVFGLVLPEPWSPGTTFRERTLPGHYWVVLGLLGVTFGISLSLAGRQEIIPERARFETFPMQLGGWTGRRDVLDKKFIDALKFEDYILADYRKPGESMPVNFYSAYYESQRQGESIHSPRSCLPAGGWEIQSLEPIAMSGFGGSAGEFRLNRAVIQKGNDRQLVYYWFWQRGRNITDEYLAKFYLFWDALTRNRTDGALVRLTTLVPAQEDLKKAEQRLLDFLRAMQPEMPRFVAD
jgi:exosortase D (VPLPA-CTERM-specific)